MANPKVAIAMEAEGGESRYEYLAAKAAKDEISEILV
jgi:hypothetical protein